jgi:hypothetical protein
LAGATLGALLVGKVGLVLPLALTGAITLLATLVYLASQQPLKSKQAAEIPAHSDSTKASECLSEHILPVVSASLG